MLETKVTEVGDPGTLPEKVRRGAILRRSALATMAFMAVVAIGFGMSSLDSEQRQELAPANQPPVAPESTSVGESEGFPSSVTMVTQGQGFSPPVIDIASGGTIEWTNDDEDTHTFTTVNDVIDVRAKPGASVSIDVGDLEPGSYEFRCRLYPMVGELIIGPPE